MKFFGWLQKQEKRILIGSIIAIVFIVVLMFATDIGTLKKSHIISYPVGEELREATFYPGMDTSKTAFLIAGNNNDNISKELISTLAAKDNPILVTSHNGTVGLESSQLDIQALETEVQLLKNETGLSNEDIFLIGYHSGGSSLLNYTVLGKDNYQGMAIISPSVNRESLDLGKIMNGNYYNEKEWVNTLDPSMVRQPTLLLSSSTDGITTPYDVTLLYNKLSGDEIIHVGGVYRASGGNVALSLVDGGYHPNTPANSNILQELLNFLKQETGVDYKLSFLYWFHKLLRLIMVVCVGILMFTAARLIRYNFSEVSHGLEPQKLQSNARFFGRKIAAWIVGFLLSGVFFMIYSFMNTPTLNTPAFYTILLLGNVIGDFICKQGWKNKSVSRFQPLKLSFKRLSTSLLYVLGTAIALLSIVFSGFAYVYPNSNDFIVMGLLSLLSYTWFLVGLEDDELFEDTHPKIQSRIVYQIIRFSPLILVAICTAIFGGGLSLLMGSYVILLLIAAYTLGKGVYYICGDMLFSSLCMSLWFEGLLMVFVVN